MSEFYHQYFCPNNERYSIIIEDDGKVAYAYLLLDRDIIGDVWIYNQEETPAEVNWRDKTKMPFLNPKRFVISGGTVNPILNVSEVKCEWYYSNDLDEVGLYVRGDLIAILKPKSFPGWSKLVSVDGPLAKKLSTND